MDMNLPTADEIKAAYDNITADGPGSPVTSGLSEVLIYNPYIADSLMRMADAMIQTLANARGDYETDRKCVAGMLGGALVYGTHLGMHIGENRGKK